MSEYKSKIDFEEISVNNKNIKVERIGEKKLISLPIKVIVDKNSFLHIGASGYSYMSASQRIPQNIHMPVFVVDRLPIIPATSFKGVLRVQLEHLIIDKHNHFKQIFNVGDDEFIKPCIPAVGITPAEEGLIGKYRAQYRNQKYTTCYISMEPKENEKPLTEYGICPVCYFMGAAGVMGFLRVYNLTTTIDSVIYQTRIRSDRKTFTAAHGAKVDVMQVKGGTIFNGSIDIILEDFISRLQCTTFGYARKLKIRDGEDIIDKWIENWGEADTKKRVELLINELLIPSIKNITELGGIKSAGAGKVSVDI